MIWICWQYIIYNTILRRFPEKNFKEISETGNVYSTTIHCLVSGITKVSRSTKLPDGLVLYRGIGGILLHERFEHRLDGEYRGFVEWGFMSTTANKEIALQYTGVDKGKPFATLLKIQPAAVDHGADISEFSQYPREQEFLWNPCSLVEPCGEVTVESTGNGLVTIIPVRVNMNLQTMTVEEIRERKKNMHLSCFRFMLEDLKRELLELRDNNKRGLFGDGLNSLPVTAFLDRIVAQVLGVYIKHKKKPPSDYNRDEKYRHLVIQMLEVKTMALSKFKFWLECKEQRMEALHDLFLREAHRAYIGWLQNQLESCRKEIQNSAHVVAPIQHVSELYLKAVAICRLKGLIDESVDDENALGECRIIRAAAEDADSRSFQMLVDARANVNSPDRNGRTAVQWASINGRVDSVKTLIRHFCLLIRFLL